jgi:hypothetical protein
MPAPPFQAVLHPPFLWISLVANSGQWQISIDFSPLRRDAQKLIAFSTY